MSGFRKLSPPRGPPDEKSAKPLKFGFVIDVGESVADWPLAARRAAPLTPAIPTNGIVTTNGVPSSGFDLIGPSIGGKPAALLIIATAAAPACWPKIGFAARAQTPRFTTASVPGAMAPKSATEQPSDSSRSVVAGLSVITLTVRVIGPVYGCSLAFTPVSVPLASATLTAGKLGDESFAATERAPSAVPGEPVMYWFGPLLPEDATTMTPAFAAFVEATADGSSAVPNEEPSDMLITSMSWSTAHSIASTTTSDEPSQPKTRRP